MTQKTILVVDDDPDIVLANRLVLESAGYAVEEAESGKAGLAKMRASRPDLVLMDVMMANPLDGYYTTQQIADDPHLRGIHPDDLVHYHIAICRVPTDQYLNIREFILLGS